MNRFSAVFVRAASEGHPTNAAQPSTAPMPPPPDGQMWHPALFTSSRHTFAHYSAQQGMITSWTECIGDTQQKIEKDHASQVIVKEAECKKELRKRDPEQKQVGHQQEECVKADGTATTNNDTTTSRPSVGRPLR